jgi:tryptophan synthase beta chain
MDLTPLKKSYNLPLLRSIQKQELVPTYFYNIVPDLPKTLPPPKLPNGEIAKPEMFEVLFTKEVVKQEFSNERFIPIPEELLKIYYEVGRPTPLLRAKRFEEAIGTTAKIYYKFEGALPTGSHKLNTAAAQAYYASKENVNMLVTETGAGQWGSALSLAGLLFGIKVRVYMTRSSYMQKPYRKILMQLYGAEVFPSPSDQTEFGRKLLSVEPDHPGSLGIAISEAIETVIKSKGNAKYSLGSVLNHVLLHQTIIGLEALKQMEYLGEYPNYVIGAIGGGSSYSGLAYPFMEHKLKNKSNITFIAVEPKAIPSITKGVYTYDYGDTAELTPLLKMYTVGHKFRTPPIHAGGLRYHGKAPSLCLLAELGYVKAISYHQTDVFNAAVLFAKSEGLIPAPESAHAIKAVLDIAREAARKGENITILFNMSGHGLLDLSAYDDYLSGKLKDYEPENIDLSYLPKID